MSADVQLLTITERDITSELCQRCASCCRSITVNVPSVEPRFRRFLRGIGLNVSPAADEGDEDCCDGTHDIRLEVGPCQHLKKRRGTAGTIYSCALYGRASRPQLCADFNCVSWAKVENSYNLNNPMLRAAQSAWARTVGANDQREEGVHVTHG